ncbi:MAG: hypothetical protein WBC65_12700, partial [Ignavibacteria bacterium]
NAALFVSVVEPPGAEPVYIPNIEELQKQLALESNEAIREKIQLCITYAMEELSKTKTITMSYEDFPKLNNPGFAQKKTSAQEFNRNAKSPGTDNVKPVHQIPGEK